MEEKSFEEILEEKNLAGVPEILKGWVYVEPTMARYDQSVK